MMSQKMQKSLQIVVMPVTLLTSLSQVAQAIVRSYDDTTFQVDPNHWVAGFKTGPATITISQAFNQGWAGNAILVAVRSPFPTGYEVVVSSNAFTWLPRDYGVITSIDWTARQKGDTVYDGSMRLAAVQGTSFVSYAPIKEHQAPNSYSPGVTGNVTNPGGLNMSINAPAITFGWYDANPEGPASRANRNHYVSNWHISITSYMPGDGNGDNFVDAADYTVWADHFGQTGSGAPGTLLGDYTRDNFVNAADYTVWADNFGRGIRPPSASSIPEPTSVVLTLAMFATLSRRRRLR